MKKKIVLISLTLALILTAVFALAACKKSGEASINDYVSYDQYMLYSAHDEDISVSITGTKREEIFIADGKVGQLSDYVRITMRPHKAEMLTGEYSYAVVGEIGSLSGNLSKDGFGVSFSADLHELSEIGIISAVKITYGYTVKELSVINRCEGIIDSRAALGKAYEVFKSDIDAALQSKSFNREVYIKLVNDGKNPDSDYYWFVSFISSKEDYWAVLVNSSDGNVISSRKSIADSNGEQ
ncbi:MAG: hypothetical protein K2M44_05455 [Clostridia bacterium]|nr:hypothetical protein [Clostridia bacterium]